MAAAHETARHRDDRQIVSQRFQYGITAGPADIVQDQVTSATCRHELFRREPGQKNAMIGCGCESESRERAVEPAPEYFRQTPPFLGPDEHELTITHLPGD